MKILVWVILVGALLFSGLRKLEHISLYLPTYSHDAHPLNYGISYEPIKLKTEDHLTLDAWFIDGDKANGERAGSKPDLPDLPRLKGRPVVLFFHGNGGNISHRIQKIRYFIKMGASVLIFDYRGYGRSEGTPTELGTYRDARAAAAEAVIRAGGKPSNIFYYGESLGCAIALQAALDLPPGGLILDSPFTSTAAMGKLVFPFLPSHLIVKNRYENLAKAPSLDIPLLVMHSPQDEVIPFAMGRSVFEAAPEPKRFHKLTGDHNSGFLQSPQWGPTIAHFLSEGLK